MLILQDLSYIHPGKELLFSNISLIIKKFDKAALIGSNGSGKTTLLKIISGELTAAEGLVKTASKPYYIPQIFGQYNNITVAQALNIEHKLQALKSILNGDATEQNFQVLNEDWTIEERCREALTYWQLNDINLQQKMGTLSGGQKTKIFLAGLSIHQPEFVLLDEPSNHLDTAARQLLYNYIRTTTATLLVVSHDRKLLNLLNNMYELSKKGITVYGGNYDFYAAQKQMEANALNEEVKSTEKALRKAKEKERETIERQQKLDARGRKKQEKAGVATIMLNTLRNNAEKSTAKIKSVHNEKINGITVGLQTLRQSLPVADQMKFGFDNSQLHKGKILFRATGINLEINTGLLWQQNLDIEITSGERIALKGLNGSGKTTLIKIMLGQRETATGHIYQAFNNPVYVDQDYSLITNSLTVYEQAQQFNTGGLQEHEIKIRLSRFLFTREDWNKRCSVLSGGEKMRLMLCCLTIAKLPPDMVILDEPTNNLDLQNIEILTAAVNEYQGTLIVVSHDAYFLQQVNITRDIKL